jgi:hypothetical protein
MPKVVEITSTQYARDTCPRTTLNTWIVIVQILFLLIAVFQMERHLRRLEHQSLSLVRHAKGCMPCNANEAF